MDNITMDNQSLIGQSIPRIEYLWVKNYRALCDLELKGITPLTVFLGPNGSGKSTSFDVFAFLSECFTAGLRRAWDRRGRFKELQTRGQEGPIVIVKAEMMGNLDSRQSFPLLIRLAVECITCQISKLVRSIIKQID